MHREILCMSLILWYFGGPGRSAGYGERAAHYAVWNYSLMVFLLYPGQSLFVKNNHRQKTHQAVFSTVTPVTVMGVSSRVCTAVRQ